MPQRRLFIFLGVIFLGLGAVYLLRPAQEPAPATTIPPPPPKLVESRRTLDSGLTSLVVTGPCEKKAALALHFGVGSEHDPEGKSGLAFVIGNLLPAQLSKRGIQIAEVHVSPTATHFVLQFAEADLARTVQALGGLVSGWDPSEEQVASAKAAALSEIARRRGGDPRLTALSYADESIRSSRAEGHLGGIASDLEALTTEEVKARLDAVYAPANLTLAIAGEIDGKVVAKLIDSSFGKATGTKASLREHGHSKVSGTLVMGSAPSVVALAIGAPPTKDPAYVGFLVLSVRLLESDVLQEVIYRPLQRPETLFVVKKFGAEEQADPAASALRGEVDAIITQPFSERDVQLVKQRFASLLGFQDLEPDQCARDPRALASSRALRASLHFDPAQLRASLEKMDDSGLDAARESFQARRTVAVAGGGEIR
jgi:predicted Zn-dependent peptidase